MDKCVWLIRFTVPDQEHLGVFVKDGAFGVWEVCMNECQSVKDLCNWLDEKLESGHKYELTIREVEGEFERTRVFGD